MSTGARKLRMIGAKTSGWQADPARRYFPVVLDAPPWLRLLAFVFGVERLMHTPTNSYRLHYFRGKYYMTGSDE